MNTFLTFVKSLQDRNVSYLKRISKNLTMLGKLTIYNSFIMSNFNFCSLVWHFCGEVNSKTVEKNSGNGIKVHIWRPFHNLMKNYYVNQKYPHLK
jgi:hypothetical protein